MSCSLPKSLSSLPASFTMYSCSSTYQYTLCGHRAFMSLGSCSQVLSTAGKPRIPLRRSRPYKPRACYLFRHSRRVDPFDRWPVFKRLRSTHRLQLRAGSSIKAEISSATNAACISNSNLTYLVSCWRSWTVEERDIARFMLRCRTDWR